MLRLPNLFPGPSTHTRRPISSSLVKSKARRRRPSFFISPAGFTPSGGAFSGQPRKHFASKLLLQFLAGPRPPYVGRLHALRVRHDRWPDERFVNRGVDRIRRPRLEHLQFLRLQLRILSFSSPRRFRPVEPLVEPGECPPAQQFRCVLVRPLRLQKDELVAGADVEVVNTIRALS